MSRKALVILDQVPFTALNGVSLAPKGVQWFLGQARLEFIPRTTPVGHATISTGRLPKDHLIQGRRWHDYSASAMRRHDVDALQVHPPSSATVPPWVDPNIALEMDRYCVAREIRNELASRDPLEPRPIIATSGKGFVTFMLGGSAADVLIFPYTTVPVEDGAGDFRLILGVLPQSHEGEVAISRASRALASHFQDFGRHVPQLTLQGGVERFRGRDGLALHWVVPRGWHQSQPRSDAAREVKRQWANALGPLWSEIDDLLQQMTLTVLEELEQLFDSDGIALISRFGTDTYGHFKGVGSYEYTGALHASVDAVNRLAGLDFDVMVTSDHGGRPTPRAVKFDEATRTTAPPMLLPPPSRAAEFFRSGDHLVGYNPPHPSIQGPSVQWWDGASLASIALDSALISASFHPKQSPAWLVLPEENHRFYETGTGRGGGEHGCGVIRPGTNGHLAALTDGEVPVAFVTMRGTVAGPPLPQVLQHVRDWFVRL